MTEDVLEEMIIEEIAEVAKDTVAGTTAVLVKAPAEAEAIMATVLAVVTAAIVLHIQNVLHTLVPNDHPEIPSVQIVVVGEAAVLGDIPNAHHILAKAVVVKVADFKSAKGEVWNFQTSEISS